MTTRITAPLGERGESFELGHEDEAALLAAISEAERGETVGATEVLRKIRGT
jgi:hypothetical protein